VIPPERAEPRERVAGTDTREASAAPTVRAAAAATALIAGPGWAAALGAPAAWQRYLALPSGLVPWMAVLLGLAGLGTAIISWRLPRPLTVRRAGQLALPAGVGLSLAVALVAFIAVGSRDAKLAAAVMPVVPLIAGWLAGQAAQLAVASCVPDVASAAAGLVTAGGLVGLIFAGHLALVAKGSGLIRATGWTIAYVVLAAINLVRAQRALPTDRAKVSARELAAPVASHGPAPATSGKKPDAEPVFLLDAISVSFGPNRVLRNATLSVAPGELVALVGGNGAGKSTLLRVAAGLVTADAGRVTVGQDEVTTLLPEERASAGLAFVSGARPVFPDLSVVENLRVAAFRSHLTPRAFNAATEAVLEIVPALARRRRARAGVLSGGEQRLLAVAQTLYRRPVVLLADELSLGLDAEARIAVLELLRVLADEGVAVVAVDHDLESLLPRSDRAALLAGGVITSEPRPERLLSKRSDLLPATFLAGAGR
jgi:ABC-type branched-subunit amino acid transport system ATPase component